MIKILIADDHKIFSETLAFMLRVNTDFQVVAICHDSDCAFETIQKINPDVVLMDINMKPMSGIETTRQLAGISSARIIGLSMHSHPSYCKKMFRAGAIGYVTKNSPTSEIFAAIREVAQGNTFICSETQKMMEVELISGVQEDDADDTGGREKETTVINLQDSHPGEKRKSLGNAVSMKLVKGWNQFRKYSA